MGRVTGAAESPTTRRAAKVALAPNVSNAEVESIGDWVMEGNLSEAGILKMRARGGEETSLEENRTSSLLGRKNCILPRAGD